MMDMDTGGHAVPHKMLIATCLGLLRHRDNGLVVEDRLQRVADAGDEHHHRHRHRGVFKVSLVGLIFMHLRWDRNFTAFIFVSSVLLVGLFISFAMMDTKEYQPEVIQDELTPDPAEARCMPKLSPVDP